MFTKHELKAMAWGYAFATPCAIAAIVLLDGTAGLLAAGLIFQIGFLVTLARL